MNSLYNLALRQSSSIQSDLTLIESTTHGSATFTSLSGQLSASLSGFSRTVDDYESMAKREMHMQKREKALQRVKKFREEEREMTTAFSNAKNQQSSATATTSSTAFSAGSGMRPGATTSGGNAESPYSLHARNSQQQQQAYGSQQHIQNGVNGSYPNSNAGAHPPQDRPDPLSAYRMNASAAAMFGDGTGSKREGYALREHTFAQQAEAQLDGFIAQGREVWGNLTEQRDILKGTQRRLRDVGVTMGLSRDVIVSSSRSTSRREVRSHRHDRATLSAGARKTNLIFAAGAIFTLVSFYYIYKWFG